MADVVLDPVLLPKELRLERDGEPVGGFTGRGWLIEDVDIRIGQVAARRVGGYVLVEAEAGLGKTALATYLAFSPNTRRRRRPRPAGTRPRLPHLVLAPRR